MHLMRLDKKAEKSVEKKVRDEQMIAKIKSHNKFTTYQKCQ